YGGAVSYNWDTDYFNWRAETNYSYRGERYSTAITSVIPDYWLANASIGFGPKEGNWRFTLWGRNITDQYYDETNNGFNSSSRRTV
ncbi:MAG: TonB-dependent receptor, partial [Asticcacaulis sp.]